MQVRWSDLVNCSRYRALQNHLQHLGVGLLFVCGDSQLASLFLHVFDGHLNRSEVELWKENGKNVYKYTEVTLKPVQCLFPGMTGQKIRDCYSA